MDITNFNNNELKNTSNLSPKRKISKTVKVIFSIAVFIFATYLLVSGIPNLQNNYKVNDTNKQELLQKINDNRIELLELCSDTTNLATLEGCKTDIPNLQKDCKDNGYSTLSICSDIRLNEFSNTIDERLVVAEQKVEELKNQISALEKQKESITSETPTQIPLSNEQQSENARIIRDCSRENEITAEEYLAKFAKIDALSEKQEESIQSNSERVSICSANIREIEDVEGYSRGSATGYWDSVAKMQSAYEQICANTEKFCESNFQIP